MTVRQSRQQLLPPSGAIPHRAINFFGHDRHVHDHPLLIHVISGSVCIELATEEITVTAGSGLWLGPGVEHSARPHAEAIMFGPRLSPHTVPPTGHLLITGHRELTNLALLILASSPSGPAQTEPFRSALDAVLADIVVEDFRVPTISRPELTAITEDPLALLVPLRTLADRHSRSARHIERMVKAETGLSFVQWRTRRRANAALQRIRAGRSHSAAARAVGYQGSDGLIKALQRLTGLPRSTLAADPARAVSSWADAQGSWGIHVDPSLTL